MAFPLQNLRFRCAISWIQSFYDDVTFPFPREVLAFPYTDLYTSTIRSELVSWLTKGAPYFRLVAHILSLPYDQVASFEDAINRIRCETDKLDVVSLSRTDPFAIEQHLSLIESVMKLYHTTFLSLDSVSIQLQRLSGAVQSVTSLEEGLLTWLRLVCDTLRRKDRIQVPELAALSSCLSNGCLLLLLLHFYIPHHIQLSNGRFPLSPDNTLGLEDAFHNATLVSNACTQVPQLKFCLSPQGIVRSSDPVMLTYVLASLSSLFICFEISDPGAIYKPPALYGALIGQPLPSPKLRASAKFHSMDSVARIGTHSRDYSVARRLITPSTDNLLSSLHSDPPARYLRSCRGVNRFPSQTVKSQSTPELSQTVTQGTCTLRQENVLKISSNDHPVSHCASSEHIPQSASVVREDVEVFPEVSELREAWSPHKQNSCKGVKSESTSSEVSLESGESLSSQPSNEMDSEQSQQDSTPHEKPAPNNGIILLNIFPVTKESPRRDPLSLLLRMEAIRLREQQAAERAISSQYDVIRQQLGHLACSYLLSSNQEFSFEEYIQYKLSSTDTNVYRNQGYPEMKSNCIPSSMAGNQADPLPSSDDVTARGAAEESKHSRTDLTPDTPDTPGKPTSFYLMGTSGDDVTERKSPFATERARNMLKMLETRNSARLVSKQISHKPHSETRPPLPVPPLPMPLSPSVSCQSLHSNPTSLLSGSGNKAALTNERAGKGKRFGSANDVTAHVTSKLKSNKQIIKNAIRDVCLAGGPNAAKKVEVLRNLADSESAHFLILFRDIIGCKFRGLYAYQADTETAFRIGGAGPRVLTPDMLVKMYKYNSGAKEFQEIPARRVSFSTDGVTILDALWSGGRRHRLD